jgi:hypothetical protein
MTTPMACRSRASTASFDDALTAPALAFLATPPDLRRSSASAAPGPAGPLEELAGADTLGFLPETQGIRDAYWQVAPPAPGLQERSSRRPDDLSIGSTRSRTGSGSGPCWSTRPCHRGRRSRQSPVVMYVAKPRMWASSRSAACSA